MATLLLLRSDTSFLKWSHHAKQHVIQVHIPYLFSSSAPWGSFNHFCILPLWCSANVESMNEWMLQWVLSWRKQPIKQGYVYLLESGPWKQTWVLAIDTSVYNRQLVQQCFPSLLPFSRSCSRTAFPDVCAIEWVTRQLLVSAGGHRTCRDGFAMELRSLLLGPLTQGVPPRPCSWFCLLFPKMDFLTWAIFRWTHPRKQVQNTELNYNNWAFWKTAELVRA